MQTVSFGCFSKRSVYVCMRLCDTERERERETEGVREVKALSIISGEGGKNGSMDGLVSSYLQLLPKILHKDFTFYFILFYLE